MKHSSGFVCDILYLGVYWTHHPKKDWTRRFFPPPFQWCNQVKLHRRDCWNAKQFDLGFVGTRIGSCQHVELLCKLWHNSILTENHRSTSYSFVWICFLLLGLSSLVEPASNSKVGGEIWALLQTKSNTFWPCCRWWRNPVWSHHDDRKKDQKKRRWCYWIYSPRWQINWVATQRVFMFTTIWGNDSIWRAYFSIGLKPPSRGFGRDFIP